jgi:hypothetical protein
MLKNLMTIFVAVLVAVQPLSTIAEAHPFHGLGAQHSPLDSLPVISNKSIFAHVHQDHNGVEQEWLVADQTRFSGDSETSDCGHCSHAHATYSASVAASMNTLLVPRQQNRHFYLSLKPFEYNSSPYRPPRF